MQYFRTTYLKKLHNSSLVGQTLIIGTKESGESHAKVVSHGRILLCQSDSFPLWRKTTEYLHNVIKRQ